MIKLITIFFVIAVVKIQTFEEPPLCGKSVITNAGRFKLLNTENITSEVKKIVYAEVTNSGDSDVGSDVGPLPYVASVQRFDVDLAEDVNIFDKRLSGAFVGTILGPTVVLVACRCVARRMGFVGNDEDSVWEPKLFGVMAGTPWDYSPVEGIEGQMRFTSGIVVHPKCELLPSLYLWDLAVLILEPPFKFIENTVESLPIPKAAQELKDYLTPEATLKMAYFTAGWGWAFNSHNPEHLKQYVSPLVVRELERCISPSNAGTVTSTVFVCVETAASYLRTQQTGDVGSPLLGFVGVNETTSTTLYVALAIKSEEDSTTPDGYSLYTRLDADFDWLGNMKAHPPSPRTNTSFPSHALMLKASLFPVSAQILNIFGRY